jgi:hypothetical protein
VVGLSACCEDVAITVESRYVGIGISTVSGVVCRLDIDIEVSVCIVHVGNVKAVQCAVCDMLTSGTGSEMNKSDNVESGPAFPDAENVGFSKSADFGEFGISWSVSAITFEEIVGGRKEGIGVAWSVN